MLYLHFRPGELLLPGARHVSVLKGAASDELKDAVRQAVAIGPERTTPQDLEFSIRQLVEIAMRGLYVWDVYTCIAVLDRLTLSLALIMDRGDHQRVWRDEKGEVRLLAETVSFESMADEAFNQIRQGGTRFPAVLIHMAGTLETLFQRAPSKRHRRILAIHMNHVVEAGRRTIGDSSDLAVLEAKARQALDFLTGEARPMRG